MNTPEDQAVIDAADACEALSANGANRERMVAWNALVAAVRARRAALSPPPPERPGDALRKLSKSLSEDRRMDMNAHLALLNAASVLDQLGVFVSVEPT